MVVLLSAGQASSFGTVRGLLGQAAEHEAITREGLKRYFDKETLNEIAGGRFQFGAVGAADRPLGPLADYKPAHCDGGDYLDIPGYPQTKADAQKALEACKAYIIEHILAAVDDAGDLVSADGTVNMGEDVPKVGCFFNQKRGKGKCNVLDHLGLAFHAAQDFYSHTNWMDKAKPGPISVLNPPGLGNTEISEWFNPRYPYAEFPNGLISGCYDGHPEENYCTYDGGKIRVRHMVLNKDTKDAPRGKVDGNYAKAMAMAALDTTSKWNWFTQKVKQKYPGVRGERIVCVVHKDDLKKCRNVYG